MMQNNCSATVVANCLLEHEGHSCTHMSVGKAWVHEVIRNSLTFSDHDGIRHTIAQALLEGRRPDENGSYKVDEETIDDA